MLAGHYATALVADQHTSKKTLFFLLVASMLPDLLWHVFTLIGFEETTPTNILEMTLKNLSPDMRYDHDLIPTFGWMILLFGIGRLGFKSHKVGLIAAFLFLLHNLADYGGGYPHHVFGPDTPSVGYAAYKTVPLLAVAYEAVFTTILLFIFFRTERRRGILRKPGNMAAIIGLFVFNIVFMLSAATMSWGERLGLPEINSVFLATIPNLMVVYWGMLFFLFYFVRKTTPASSVA
ncbi:MAG: hypothetical protein GC152_14985 [Alphaproteobacteria bacterium]|nr:hypothetical protein [Alphaproteobacteria bacterium]